MNGQVGIVVIGRNEGERLVRCLESVRSYGRVVYVDSGSTDGSVVRARDLGASTVELDRSRPFTAARARNVGFGRLMELQPRLCFVQFIDGDCEVRDGWLDAGSSVLAADTAVAAVCGRLRERHPEQSIYNRICDIGWDYPIGEIPSCGGVAMYRVEQYAAAGGFNEVLFAGEEFEFCSRLRGAGGRIVRIDAEMAWHDVGITRLGQWWKRAVRSGYGAAEGWVLYPPQIGREHRRRLLRAVVWGGLIPTFAVAAMLASAWWRPASCLAGLAVLTWFANVCRLAWRELRQRRGPRLACLLAAFAMIGKTAELQGVLEFWRRRFLGSSGGIIEYRGESATVRP